MKHPYVQVYSANGQLAGEMIRILLESVDIPVLVVQESAGITYGLTVGPLGEVKVYVPANQVEEATQVIQAMEDGELNRSFYPGLFASYPQYKNNKFGPEELIKEEDL